MLLGCSSAPTYCPVVVMVVDVIVCVSGMQHLDSKPSSTSTGAPRGCGPASHASFSVVICSLPLMRMRVSITSVVVVIDVELVDVEDDVEVVVLTDVLVIVKLVVDVMVAVVEVGGV